MTTLTVKDLQEAIKDLPENAPVVFYNANGVVDHYKHLEILNSVGYICNDGSGGIWWEEDEPLPDDFEADGTKIIHGLILTDGEEVRQRDLSVGVEGGTNV